MKVRYFQRILSVILVITAILSLSMVGAFAKAPKKNGNYTVGVQMWNAEKNEPSMSNAFFKKTAKLRVKDGKLTMTLYANSKAIRQTLQGAYKIDMKVSNGRGGYTPVKVVARDSTGSPTAFQFTLPNTKKYVPVKLNPHVAAMGNSYVDARLKIDYSTVKPA